MSKLTTEQKYQQMTTAPVEGLICRMAVPTIASMLITTLYNMADAFFVGQLQSASASGAVGVAASLMAVIQAIGFFFGQGAGNNASRQLGNKNYKRAEELASTGFFSALISGFLLMVVGFVFLKDLTRLLGSTETILPYAMDYIRIILIGAPYMTASLVLNNLLRFQGNAFYAMIGLTSGGILNIILDPILIIKLNMGISGAAVATVVSQAVSFLILLWQTHRASIIKIHLHSFSPNRDIYGTILNGGLPSLFRQSIASAAAICLNTAARPFGDAAIAAMAICSRVAFFSNSVVIGFGQGFQPVCGYNYGAKLYDRVRRSFWFCVKLSTVALIIMGAAEFLLATPLVRAFLDLGDDTTVLEIGRTALRYQCLSMPLFGWIMLSNMMEQTCGRVVSASILGIARQGIFLIPAVFILPGIIGITGIQIAQPIADVVAFLIALPLQLHLLQQIKEEEQGIRAAK